MSDSEKSTGNEAESISLAEDSTSLRNNNNNTPICVDPPSLAPTSQLLLTSDVPITGSDVMDKPREDLQDAEDLTLENEIRLMTIDDDRPEQETGNLIEINESNAGLQTENQSLDAEMGSDSFSQNPSVRTISSYFADVDADPSTQVASSSPLAVFDFLAQSPTSASLTDEPRRQPSMTNFFVMEGSGTVASTADPFQLWGQRSDNPNGQSITTSQSFDQSVGQSISPELGDECTGVSKDDLLFSSLDADLSDAWIPSEKTHSCLVAINTGHYDHSAETFYPEADQITMPGVVMQEELVDPLGEMVLRFSGPQEATKRQTLNVNSVSQDALGLRQLIAAECFRSAVALTGRLLHNIGQGPGRLGQASKHTPLSLQLWLTRAALLVKLHMFTVVEAELEAFGDFDRVDMFYAFYPPGLYPGKWGSLVPFALRIIWAELPAHTGKPDEALDRLFGLQAVVQQMLENLESGLAPDGSSLQLASEVRIECLKTWRLRQLRLLHSVANTLCQLKDLNSAVKVYEQIADLEEAERKPVVLSGVGRMLLQLGDIQAAEHFFEKSEACFESKTETEAQILSWFNQGFLSIGRGQFDDACIAFQEVLALQPLHPVAMNNVAVMMIYVGKLREALDVLQCLVKTAPRQNLQDGVVFNLATLYELETSKALDKKKEVLNLVALHKGDGFNPQCLKLT